MGRKTQFRTNFPDYFHKITAMERRNKVTIFSQLNNRHQKYNMKNKIFQLFRKMRHKKEYSSSDQIRNSLITNTYKLASQKTKIDKNQ